MASSHADECAGPDAKRRKFAEEEEPQQTTQTLKWRGDPRTTYSDWTIQIISKDSAATPEGVEEERATVSLESYHVHKYILACGVRKSEYFASLFQNSQNGNFSEAKENISVLELDPLAAKAFPVMLDFLYDQDKPLNIHTEIAVPLYYLGEYLDIKHLRWESIQFCKKDISLANVHAYNKQATAFHSESVLGIIAKFLGENILDVTTKSNILVESDPRLWINAFEFIPRSRTWDASVHISNLVATFGENKAVQMDLETLHKLTQDDFMPIVDPNSALAICALEDTLKGDQSPPEKELSSLQQRCIDSLSDSWQSLVSTDECHRRILCERKSAFLADLLLKSLEDANHMVEACEGLLSMAKEELSTSQTQLAITKQSLSSVQLQLSSTRSELSRTKEKLRKFKEELRKFKPVESTWFGNHIYKGMAPVAETLRQTNSYLDSSAKTILFEFRKYNQFGVLLSPPVPDKPCSVFIYSP